LIHDLEENPAIGNEAFSQECQHVKTRLIKVAEPLC
jgi:hypothetical protein